MKTYEQLTDEQKTAAVERELRDLLEIISEGQIRFNDELNGDGLQARIDAAWEKANEMQTPWFVSEYIMDTCSDDLESMAQASAEDAEYAGANDPRVVTGIAS